MSISLQQFLKMVNATEKILIIEREHINNLNVFPVPDGDTGSNMYSTVQGACNSLKDCEFKNFKEFADVFAKGMLMNARGNSGVILSQIIRGFVSNFTDQMHSISVTDLKKSFELAKEWAYKAVTNPIEGTILTVIRVIAEEINKREYLDEKDLFNDVIEYGSEALNNTPNLLPELKEVGVVDSGGYGLMCFFKAMNSELNNSFDELVKKINSYLVEKNMSSPYNESNFNFFSSKKDEGFGYCSEIILNLDLQIKPNSKVKKDKFDLNEFKNKLLLIGDSLVCTQIDNYVKVHIHTFKPFLLLKLAQKYGEFERIKIENMTLQHEEKINQTKKSSNLVLVNGLSVIITVPTKKIGDFIKDDFLVDRYLSTEDNGAPSISDFINAIYKEQKNNVLIITDDSNIILTANEVKKNLKDVKVEVIPAKNVFEALVCSSIIDKSDSLKSNYSLMMKTLRKTLSAVISTSTKDVSYSHIDVKKNNKIGIIDKKIVVSTNDDFIALKVTLDKLIKNKKGYDICFLILGKNVDMDAIKKFEKYASEQYGLYCEIRMGDQKVYNYYLGLQ